MAETPSKKRETLSLPDKESETLSLPDKENETLSLPDKENETLSLPSKERSTLSLPSKERSTLSLPSKSTLSLSSDQKLGKKEKSIQQILSGGATKSVVVEYKHRKSPPGSSLTVEPQKSSKPKKDPRSQINRKRGRYPSIDRLTGGS